MDMIMKTNIYLKIKKKKWDYDIYKFGSGKC